MSQSSFRLLALLSVAFTSISIVTATPQHLPKYPIKRAYTGTAVYSTGTTVLPTCPTYSPPSTASTTRSSSTSSTAPPTGTPTSFKIRVQAFNYYDPPPPIDGYAYLIPPGPYDDGAQVFAYTDDASLALTFTLNADGTLQTGDLIATMPREVAYHDVWFQTQATIASEGLYKTICRLDGEDLYCATNTGSYYTNDALYTCGSEGAYGLTYGPTYRPYNVGCYSLFLSVVEA